MMGLFAPLAAMGLHALYRGDRKAHARLAMVFHVAYGALLILLSVLNMASGLYMQSRGAGIPFGFAGFTFEPSLYLNPGNAPLLLLMGISLPLTFIWLRDREGRYGASYYISANLLVFSLVGVFVSQSLILFYLFWESALVGAYFWIGMHGRAHAYTPMLYPALARFALMTLLGSLPMLLSIVLLSATAGRDPGIFGIETVLQVMEPWARWLAFAGFALAFAVKMPLLGLHGWLRDTYNVAPAACRTLLSALMSKMGAYGFVFILAAGFSEESRALAPYFQVVCVVGAVYGGLLCLSSERFADILIYSSLAHLSIIGLGVFTAVGNEEMYSTGITGAVFLIFNHGLIMTALFAFDARITVTGESPSLFAAGGLREGQRRLSALLLLSIFASASLPGLSNFGGELMVFLSAFSISPWLTFFSAAGVLIVAATLIRAYHSMFLGTRDDDSTLKQASDFGIGETALALCLGLLWLVLGLYPMLFVGPVQKAFLIPGLGGM